MPSKTKGLQELMIQELQDMYDAEKQLVRALPKLAKAASDEELGNAFREHLEVTKGHVERIERVFESLDKRARSKPCSGMKGIVEEGAKMIEEEDNESLLDAALAGGARKVEHYEMMAYESLRAMAQQLGLDEVAQLLEENLQEEMQADQELEQIGKRLIETASEAGTEEAEGEEENARPSRTRTAAPAKTRTAR